MWSCSMRTLAFVILVCFQTGCRCNDLEVIPESVDIWEYTDVTISCSFIEPGIEIVWTVTPKNAKPILFNMVKDKSNTNCLTGGNYSTTRSVVYNCENGNMYSITLKNNSNQNDGETWQCTRFSSSNGRSNIVTIKIKVPVTASTISPYHTLLSIPENSTHFWQCKSSKCRPKPIFRWYIESPYGNHPVMIERDPEGDLSDDIQPYTSTVSFTFNRTWNGWFLVCGANNKLDNNFVLSEKIKINVTYPPDGPPRIRNIEDENKVVSTVNVIVGGFVNLQCSVSGGNPQPTLQWNVNNESPQTVSANIVTKNISWPATNIDVNIELECSSIHNLTEKSIVSVNILYPPETPIITVQTTSGGYTAVTRTLDVIEGRSFTVNCSAKSNPQVFLFKWNDLPPSNNSVLYVDNVERHHAETITCNVSNVMKISDVGHSVTGTNSTHRKVNALYPPNVNSLSDVTVIEEDDLHYSCNFTQGNPTSTNITWSWKSITWDGQYLQLNNVSRNQAGVYRCSVRNVMAASDGNRELGNNSGSFNLTVQYETKVLNFLINGDETNQIIVNENSTVNISCEMEGDPSPEGKLLHQMTIYIANQPARTFSTSQQSTNLRLSSVFYAMCSDTGIHTCIGSNTFHNGRQSTSNRSTTFFVNCSPRQYPSFELKQNVTSALNATVTFLYTTMAYPTPVVQWYRIINGVETSITLGGVVENNYISLNVMQTKYTLEHVEASHFGEYLLNITNQYGNFQQRFHLVAEATESPSDTFSKPNNVGAAVGGAVGGLLAIVIIVVASIMVRKRHFGKQTNSESGESDFETSHTYTNFSKANTDDQTIFLETKQTSSDSPKLPERMPLKLAATHSLQELDDYDNKADERVYGNTYEMIKRIDRINVSELLPYLTNKPTDFFGSEFSKLPKGLTQPYDFSQKPENIALNRYNGIYPYDHSRVKIADEPAFFINACYVDGYKKKNAFIASLGPLSRTTYNFVTFWKMVWSEKSDVIVMLTKLSEPSGVKCDPYWPKPETTQEYGEVTVTSVSEDEYSDYVLRIFTLSKGSVRRKLMQFHFMAWPDKSVPEDVTCLLEFQKRVNANHSSGPIIVHCSAGIGRTGTLIAIEILIEEGRRKGSVNVVECVKTMRDQRTSMVQTVDQYNFIYKSLVNALVFDCETITAKKFPKFVDRTNTDQYNKMFQTLNQSVEADSTSESNARTANKTHRDKNRVGCDIPGDFHRVRLFLNRDEETSTDYINAVLIDSFTKTEHFIVAQSPMTNGVEDFLCMVYQVECTCIVSLGDTQEGRNVGMYIPADSIGSLSIGSLNVTCKVLETKDNYVVRKMKIEFKGKYERGEKVVYHFDYTDWALGQKTPNDPQGFVQFTREVEDFASQLGSGKSQVLVHCLNAYERSCLFCAIVTLVEKVKYEGEVCVSNTLRHIRARRKLAIPNLEQFQFCFRALCAYINMDTQGSSIEEKSYINTALA